jgi:O-antigen/teichoic acid export membrane protein
LRKFRVLSVISVGQTLFATSGILLIFAADAWTVKNLVWAGVAAAFLAALAAWSLAPRDIFLDPSGPPGIARRPLVHMLRPPRDALERDDGKGIQRFASLMVLSAVISQITTRVDIWVIGSLLDSSQIGIYSVATKFTMPLTMLLGAVSTALWPRAGGATDGPAARVLLLRTLRLSGLLSVVTVAYSVGAPLVAGWLFGDVYAPATTLAQVLCIRYCLSILVNPLGIIGFNLGLVRLYCLLNLLQLTVVVGLNVLLLPKIGAMGAAVSLVCNEVLGALVVSWAVARALRRLATVDPATERHTVSVPR